LRNEHPTLLKNKVLERMVELVNTGRLNPLEVIKFETTGELTAETRRILGMADGDVIADDPPSAKDHKGPPNLTRKKSEW
jgi:hypothetical protein